jgi:hypothetical protein
MARDNHAPDCTPQVKARGVAGHAALSFFSITTWVDTNLVAFTIGAEVSHMSRRVPAHSSRRICELQSTLRPAYNRLLIGALRPFRATSRCVRG